MVPTSPRIPPTAFSISSPQTVCCLTTSHSSSLSCPGLLMISFGTRTLPTSWRSAANSAFRRSRPRRPIRSETSITSETTSRLCAPVP